MVGGFGEEALQVGKAVLEALKVIAHILGEGGNLLAGLGIALEIWATNSCIWRLSCSARRAARRSVASARR